MPTPAVRRTLILMRTVTFLLLAGLTAAPGSAWAADLEARLRSAEPRLSVPGGDHAARTARRHDLRRLDTELKRTRGTGAARARLRRLEEGAAEMPNALPARPSTSARSERTRLLGKAIPRTHLTLDDIDRVGGN